MSQKSSIVNLENEEIQHAYVVYYSGESIVIAVCTSEEQAIKIIEAQIEESPEESPEDFFIFKAPFDKFHEVPNMNGDYIIDFSEKIMIKNE